MRKRREIVLKAFLNQCPPEKRESLVRFLPSSEQTVLSSLPDIPLQEEGPSNHLFEHIHWSWFIPLIQSYPLREQRLFLRAIPISAQKNLGKALALTPATEKLSPTAIAFLRQTLLRSVAMEDLLPINHLPPSPLNLLLKIEKKKLTQLIDFLSLYDLSSELRQIVETKILKKIYSCLSEDEKKFLKLIAGHKEPYPSARISIEKWDGTKKSLRTTLHRIGLARLGAALSGQDPDLIWYVCHQLDSGRGKALEKLCGTEAVPGVSQWLAEQMKELL